MLGNYTEEETDYSIEYTWTGLPMNVSIDVYDDNGEKRLHIDPSINDNYYKIDPLFNSTDSIKNMTNMMMLIYQYFMRRLMIMLNLFNLIPTKEEN